VAGFYIYGNYIDEVLCMYGPGLLKFVVHDHLYSPVALIGVGAAVLERYEYDAYGNCRVLEPNFADDPDGKSDFANPYFFTGRQVDTLDSGSLKIQYNRNRYYDYYTGRWFTQDPMGYVDGLNLYEYVRGNPCGVNDPFGTCACVSLPPWWLRWFADHALDFTDVKFGHGKLCFDVWERDTHSHEWEEVFVDCAPSDINDQTCDCPGLGTHTLWLCRNHSEVLHDFPFDPCRKRVEKEVYADVWRVNYFCGLDSKWKTSSAVFTGLSITKRTITYWEKVRYYTTASGALIL